MSFGSRIHRPMLPAPTIGGVIGFESWIDRRRDLCLSAMALAAAESLPKAIPAGLRPEATAGAALYACSNAGIEDLILIGSGDVRHQRFIALCAVSRSEIHLASSPLEYEAVIPLDLRNARKR